MRPGSELITFIESKMQMSDVYQPAIILELLYERGYRIPETDLALHLEPYFPLLDQNEVLLRIDRWPRQVLESHDVLQVQRGIWTLNFSLDPETASTAADLCSRRIADWRSKQGEIRTWLAVATPELAAVGSDLFLAADPEWDWLFTSNVRPGDLVGWVDSTSGHVVRRSRVLFARPFGWVEGVGDELARWFGNRNQVWIGPVGEADDNVLAFGVDRAVRVNIPVKLPDGSLDPLKEADAGVAIALKTANSDVGGDTHQVWWVNQGQTFAAERAGGYIWAPQKNKAGTALTHHTNVARVREGDVVVHYAGGSVRALGRATADGVESDRPDGLSGESWERPGYRANISYSDLGQPIDLVEIPESERIEEPGPFTQAGNVNQGYLYSLTPSFSAMLQSLFADRWPKGSPWNAPRHAFAVYVGSRARENLSHGLANGVWGWRQSHSDYDKIEPGDLLIFGSGFTGGSPRQSAEEFANHGFDRIVECEAIDSLREHDQPEWPDEVQAAGVIYPFRIRLGAPIGLGALSVRDLDSHYGSGVGEALRLSATQGGRGVPVSPTHPGDKPKTNSSDASLADVCVAVADAIRASGLNYGDRHDDLIRSFVVSLATKRFALLTGLSGSGKSRLGIAFGQWLGENQYKVVAVRPDWTGPDALLGYENLLSDKEAGSHAWVVPETLEFMLQAAADPSQPYLLLLDEMNLAHVERYFADVLSGIESRERIIPHLANVSGDWRKVGEDKLRFPENLFVVGTVNIDETTYMFSPKVLDRANTLEFRVRTADLDPDAPPLGDVAPGDPVLARRFLADATDRDVTSSWVEAGAMADALIDLHRRLSVLDREFGHRVFQESIRFGALLARAGDDNWRSALDLQVMQKVLPRIHGSVKQVIDPLRELGTWCFYGPGSGVVDGFDVVEPPEGSPALPVSFDKIQRMYRRATANHFVSFAE